MDKRIKFEYRNNDPKEGIRRVIVPIALVKELKGWVEIKNRRHIYKHFHDGKVVFRTFRKRLTRDISLLIYNTVGMGISLIGMTTTPEYECWELRCVISKKVGRKPHYLNVSLYQGYNKEGHLEIFHDKEVRDAHSTLLCSHLFAIKPGEEKKFKVYP